MVSCGKSWCQLQQGGFVSKSFLQLSGATAAEGAPINDVSAPTGGGSGATTHSGWNGNWTIVTDQAGAQPLVAKFQTTANHEIVGTVGGRPASGLFVGNVGNQMALHISDAQGNSFSGIVTASVGPEGFLSFDGTLNANDGTPISIRATRTPQQPMTTPQAAPAQPQATADAAPPAPSPQATPVRPQGLVATTPEGQPPGGQLSSALHGPAMLLSVTPEDVSAVDLRQTNGGFATWEMVAEANGFTRIRNFFAQTCLDVRNTDTNPVTSASCGDFSGQYWSIRGSVPGPLTLTTMFRGDQMCLEVSNGGGLRLAPCNGLTSQQWNLNLLVRK